MSRLTILIAIALAIGLYLFGRWFSRTPPEQVAKGLRRGLLTLAGLFLILLAVTGRLHWLFALIGGLLPFAQRAIGLWKLAQQLGLGRNKGSPGQTSRITTRFLEMTLDHDSGALGGRVIAGQFEGRDLGDLVLADLVSLYNECARQDPQSATVLETYLDRSQGVEWRTQAGVGTESEQNGRPANTTGPMSRNEALQILGLEEGANDGAIKLAHKRLMQKLHPDQGGSNHLATLINQAKSLLLKR